MTSPFQVDVSPDWQSLVDCIMRRGTPQRAHHIELFLDYEVQLDLGERFGVWEALDKSDPNYHLAAAAELQKFLGYDYVRMGAEGIDFPLYYDTTEDTAELGRQQGRSYVNLHKGPIASWEDFEKYPWPKAENITTRALEYYDNHLPEGMCIIGSGGFAHFAELLSWLMGYETLCLALFDQRDLVEAIANNLVDIYRAGLKQILQHPCVEIVWGSDDMGFRSQTLISPADLREYVFPGHKLMAEMAHQAGKPYLLHSCGNLHEVMEDLIVDVKIDAKHSFEDTIEDVCELKGTWGQRIALLGGIDVDFMCRATPDQIRERVRKTLEVCMPGGGYCLGSGNSVANYIPVENYLAMMDEGRSWGR